MLRQLHFPHGLKGIDVYILKIRQHSPCTKCPYGKLGIVNQKMGGARALQYRAFHFTYCEINSQNLLRIQLNAACAEEGMVKMGNT